MVKLLELFGGIGAPRVALRNLGVTVKSIDYVEIDKNAVKSYNAIFSKELELKPNTVVDYSLQPDILVHGSPCQDFSIAGLQNGGDIGSNTRSSLMWETIKIIYSMGEWKPKFVIWENVKNVLSKKMVNNFNRYLDEMKKLGYTSNFSVLNTIDFGLPQNRERLYVVSCLDGTLFNFETLEKKSMKNINDYLGEYEEKHIVSQPSMLKKINSNDINFGGRVNIIKDYCYTITTKQMRCPNSGVIDLGNGNFRYLTEKECWLLQGFSKEDYEAALKANPGKPGKLNGILYKQAGNSMSVSVLEAIFKQLLNL